MKKYIYLIALTIIAAGAIILSGSYINGNALAAETYELVISDAENYITVSGNLRTGSVSGVSAEGTGLINEVYVKSGDRVEKGDRLFSCYYPDESYSSLLNNESDIMRIESLIGGIADSTVKDSMISKIKQYSELREVLSPGAGVISGIKANAGDIVRKDMTVIQIGETKNYEIPVNINETSIGNISKGQNVSISFPAVEGKKYSGKVAKIADTAEQTGGLTGKETTVEVIIALDEGKTEDLRVGYSAVCSIMTSSDKDVLLLPYDLIRTDNGGDHVYIAEKGKARKVYIQTGREYKNSVEVRSGLKEHDRVIINSEDIYDGQRITL